MNQKEIALKQLKPLNSVIQICPVCNKVDVYLNDGHDCLAHVQHLIAEEYSAG